MWILALFILSLVASSTLPAAAFEGYPSIFDEDHCNHLFVRAPDYHNGPACPLVSLSSAMAPAACDPSVIHVAMTLDADSRCSSVAAIHSVLKHASCPENLFFHFLSDDSSGFTGILHRAFPSLNFTFYRFDPDRNLISSDSPPLNYAPTYLADILPPCISRVIYLNSYIIVLDDIARLWSTSLPGSHSVIASMENCDADFTYYFSDLFWSDQSLAQVFDGRTPCYFSTDVMVMGLDKWRSGNYSQAIKNWMLVQKEKRIYDDHLGSLPPFLLVFAGEIEPIEQRWDHYGDDLVGSCKGLAGGGDLHLDMMEMVSKPCTRLDAQYRLDISLERRAYIKGLLHQN